MLLYLRKSALLWAFVLSCAFSASAQEGRVNVTVITESGSRVNGQIGVSVYNGTASSFPFQREGGSPSDSITLASIRTIELPGGAQLEKRMIRVPVISLRMEDRTQSQYELPSNYYEGPALLEKLVSGSIELFCFVDRFDHPHFYYRTSKDTSMVHLKNETYLEENYYLKRDPAFRNLISFIVTQYGCPDKLNDQVASVQDTKISMVRLFRKLNECAGSESEVYTKNFNDAQRLGFGVLAGVVVSRLQVDEDQSRGDGLRQSHFGFGAAPAFGVFMDIMPSRRVKNFMTSVELSYYSQKTASDSFGYQDGRARVDVKYSTVQLLPLIRFIVTRSKVSPMIELGYGIQRRFGIKDQMAWYNTFGAYRSQPFQAVAQFGGVPVAGAGVQFPNFSINFRANLASAATTQFGARPHSFFGLVRIRLRN